MSWIALRDRQGIALWPDGATPPGPKLFADPGPLAPRGTLMIEVLPGELKGERLVLDAVFRQAWPGGLRLSLGPGNRVNFRMWQSNRQIDYSLRTGPLAPRRGLILHYAWDAPARRATLCAYVPGQEAMALMEFSGPIPLFFNDIAVLMDPAACHTAPEVRFIALSDMVEPVGPVPGFAPGAAVLTPSGEVPIEKIRVGSLVTTSDGHSAQVRWAGSMLVPSRGSLRPMLLRAPYRGLNTDVTLAQHQRLALAGSTVEYLFNKERVAFAAGYLRDDRTAILPATSRFVRYHQILIDRPAFIVVAGMAAEPLDLTPMLRDRGLWAHTILRDLPAALVPRQRRPDLTVLNDYEALMLAQASCV